MKYCWLGVCALLSLVPAAYGQGTSATETIPLKYLAPQNVAASIKTPQGIANLTCDFSTNSVTVLGSPQAVAAFKAELQKADVPQTTHQTEMRFIRCHVDAHGKYTEEIVSKPMLRGLEGYPATLSVMSGQSGYTFQVTPTQDTDKTVLLTVEVRELGEQGEIIQSGKNTRRVMLGETVRFTGMTEATDKELRRAVQQGKVVVNRGEYTGYYVEVKPTIPHGLRNP